MLAGLGTLEVLFQRERSRERPASAVLDEKAEPKVPAKWILSLSPKRYSSSADCLKVGCGWQIWLFSIPLSRGVALPLLTDNVGLAVRGGFAGKLGKV